MKPDSFRTKSLSFQCLGRSFSRDSINHEKVLCDPEPSRNRYVEGTAACPPSIPIKSIIIILILIVVSRGNVIVFIDISNWVLVLLVPSPALLQYASLLRLWRLGDHNRGHSSPFR